MNNNVKKEVVRENASWICCPICGKRKRKVALACELCKCDNCDNEFGAYVVKGAVLVTPIQEKENSVTMFYRISQYMDQLITLTEPQ